MLAVSIITVVLSLIASIVLGEAGADPAGFLFRNIGPAIFTAVFLAYFGGLEHAGAKGTLGKNALGVAVAAADGSVAGGGRTLVRAAAKLLLGWALPIAFLLPRRRAPHDFIAGTAVLRIRP